MTNLNKNIEESFKILETLYKVTYYRLDTRRRLIEAFSQLDESPYTYLGYQRSESLSKLMNRMIQQCDKPHNVEWRGWLLKLNNTFLCSICKVVYSWDNKSVDATHNHCKNCANTKTKNRLRTARQFIYDYLKDHPCIDCGETNPIALEFDHRDPTLKLFNIADSKFLSINKIKEEISKCDVVCANCHRGRTAKQFSWYKDLM